MHKITLLLVISFTNGNEQFASARFGVMGLTLEHPETYRHLYASVNWIVAGWDNGLLPDWSQAINWSNTPYCQLEPSEQMSVYMSLK